MIYKEGERSYRQRIPHAELEMEITTGYGNVSVNFKDFNGNSYNKKAVNKVSFYAQGKVASYIADTLNVRMSQLIKESKEISTLGILVKYRQINEQLVDENKNLKEQIKELRLKQNNQSLTSAINELNSRWYVRIARLF